MAVYLYRLGRFAFRNRWAMLGFWIVMLVGSGIAGTTLSGQTTAAFSVPGIPSQEAFDLMAERAPEMSEGGTRARFVFAVPDGRSVNEPEYRAAIEATLEELAAWPSNFEEVFPDRELEEALPDNQTPSQVRSPFETQSISPNEQVALAEVLFFVQADGLIAETRDFLFAAGDAARDAGLQVEVAGDALQAEVEPPASELIGVAVAALVLVITFSSLLAAGLPLMMAFFGVGIGSSLIALGTGFIDMSAESGILATMLGIAVSIDYALFIVSRFRVELASGKSIEEAIGIAVGTAGNAVVFAGATVMIALAGLSVVGIPFLTIMAFAAVITVFFAVLIAISLLPAILGFVGRRALSRKSRRNATAQTATSSDASTSMRWGRFVTSNPLAVLLVAVIGLGVLAIPAFQIELGFPGDESSPEDSTNRKAYDLISENFGPGFNGPLLIVADIPEGVPAQPAMSAIRDALTDIDGVAFVGPAIVNQASDLGIVSVTPTTAPSEAETADLVRFIRDSAEALAEQTGVAIGVTGITAILIDVSDRLGEALTPYLIVVVGLAMVLLLLVFRSIVVPIKATLGFLLTIGATFGAVVAVFQWGWLAGLLGVEQIGPILSFLPIFMIGVVFGLAMDYQFFLVTRMREEYVKGASPRDAVIRGIGFSGRIVTAAAIIMISVFLGFVAAPSPIIKSIGFALAFGVLVDAFVVRLTIVPAVLALLGRSAWWLPRWLNAIIPNVDVEGEKLRKLIGEENKSAAPQPAE